MYLIAESPRCYRQVSAPSFNRRISVLKATISTVARKGNRVVGLLVDTKDYERCYIGDFMRDDSAVLVRALVRLANAQTRLPILHLSIAPRFFFSRGRCRPNLRG